MPADTHQRAFSTKALLDTDTFSEILKGVDNTVVQNADLYLSAFESFTICVITVIEIVRGYRRRQREHHIAEFLRRVTAVEALDIGQEVGELASRIFGDLERTGQTIGWADPIIAATAIHHRLTLVTGNTDHFRRTQALGYDLALDNWRLP